MMGKNRIESFIANIDKILSGDLVIPAEYMCSDEEEKQLLFLAQLLARADYAGPKHSSMEELWSSIQRGGQLEDDELDMVAGGLNENAILDEKNKKDGI